MIKEEIRCPRCKDWISNVRYECDKITHGNFFPQTEEFDEDMMSFDDFEYVFSCPNCDEKLGDDIEDILDLFRKKDDVKEVIEEIENLKEEENKK